MKKTIVLILLLIPMLCFAGALQEKHRSVIAKKNVATGDGPNAWYYTCTATPTSEPTYYGVHEYQSNTKVYCNPITLPAGTLTKFGVKADETYTEYEKMALYDTSGNRLSGSCVAGTFTTGWVDCTLDTSYVVTAGNYYVCGMVDTADAYVKFVKTGFYYEDSKSYASFPYSTLTLTEGTEDCLAYRVYMD